MCGNCNYVLSELSLPVGYLIKFYISGGVILFVCKYIYNFVPSLVDCICMMLVLEQVGWYRYIRLRRYIINRLANGQERIGRDAETAL